MNRPVSAVAVALCVLAPAVLFSAPPPDVAGLWALVFETPMGERTYMTSFVQEGEILRVVMKSSQGTELKTTGSIKGDELDWVVVISGPMGEIPLVFKGRLEGEEMTGTVGMGEAGEAEFKARKIK